MKRNIAVLFEWIGLSALGMVAGVLFASQVVGYVLWRWYDLPSVPAHVALFGVLFIAGLVHGGAMGFAQSFVLKSRLHVPRDTWVLMSSAGAGLAWAVGGAATFLGGEPWDSTDLITALVLGGFLLGGILGFAQWLALRRYVSFSIAWVPVNSLAWVAGTAFAFATASWMPADPSAQQVIVAALVGTLGAGAMVGLVTGLTLRILLLPMARRDPRLAGRL